ncbi:unnamed protein product [Cuscuta europaea]|nr:unnamed protein product [Cuscuta europaea]
MLNWRWLCGALMSRTLMAGVDEEDEGGELTSGLRVEGMEWLRRDEEEIGQEPEEGDGIEATCAHYPPLVASPYYQWTLAHKASFDSWLKLLCLSGILSFGIIY